jgi:hypothetical protein
MGDESNQKVDDPAPLRIHAGVRSGYPGRGRSDGRHTEAHSARRKIGDTPTLQRSVLTMAGGFGGAVSADPCAGTGCPDRLVIVVVVGADIGLGDVTDDLLAGNNHQPAEVATCPLRERLLDAGVGE